jgi:hypothetical protein
MSSAGKSGALVVKLRVVPSQEERGVEGREGVSSSKEGRPRDLISASA